MKLRGERDAFLFAQYVRLCMLTIKFFHSIGKEDEIEKFNGVAGGGIIFQRGRK